MKRILLLFILIYFATQNMIAQNEVQKTYLKNIASEAAKIEKQQKIEADSIAKKLNIPIRTEYSDGRVMELQRFENGRPVYYVTDNIKAAATLSSDKVWPNKKGGYSLSGKNQLIGLWDGGSIRLTHQEFTGRVKQIDNPSALSDHSNHVTGTMIAAGIDANAKGMSSSASVNAYDYNNDFSEVSGAAGAGLKVSNHSYGSILGWYYNYKDDGKWAWFGDTTISKTEDYNFGYYSTNSAKWDAMLFNAPYYLVCKSAGNNRDGTGPAAGTPYWLYQNGNLTLSTTPRDRNGGATGYGLLEYRGVAKNTLTVGAVNPVLNYTKPADVVMSDFSDWGPTDDGRIKPDIVADGINLYSSISTADNAYGTMSGTSMATPNVTGSVALILEHQNNLHPDTALYAATIKGLIIHTAEEAGANPGPDYSFGWGLMNTWKAVQLISLNAQMGGNQLIKELTLNQGAVYEYQVKSNGNEPLKVTISWSDWAGTPAPISLNPTNLMLVNDLDLRIIGPNGTYMPWVLDPSNPSKAATTGDNFRDNVEQVLVQAPVAGTYTIRVTHKGSLVFDKQNFSMIVSGIALTKPGTPVLSSPDNGSVEQNYDMNFVWKLSDRATSYQVQVAKDSLFSGIVVNDTLVSGAMDQTTSLPGLTNLYWRVRGLNNGGTSSWSSVWKFKTKLGFPGIPVLISPADGATKQPLKNITLKWKSADNAFTYNVKVNAGLAAVVNATNLTDTSYVVTATLTEGKKYSWSANTVNTTGISTYATAYNFITILLAPDSLNAVNAGAKRVALSWSDKSSAETMYYIARKKNPGTIYTVIDSLKANSVTYTDSSVAGNTSYTYKIYCANSVISSDSSNEATIQTITGVNDNGISLPQEYSLSQNYPNPFNPKTVIKYAVPFNSEVKMTVINLLGQTVKELVNGIKAPGYHEVEFDGSNLSSGIYFYTITAKSADGSKEFRNVKKLVLLK